MHTAAIAAAAILLCQASATDLARHLASGYQLLESGQAAEAQRELSAAVAADPRSVDARILLGMADYHLNRDREAVQNLQAALELEPASVQARYVLGLLSLRRRDLDSAEKHLSLAYAADPRRADILQSLTQVLLTRPDAAALARVLEQGRQAGIENAGLQFSLAWAYSEMHEFSKAEEAAGVGLRLSPQNRGGWITLVKSQLQQGEAGRMRALDTLEQSGQVPALAETWQHAYLTGLTNYMLDRHDTAVSPLREALRKSPDQGLIHLLLAICLTSKADNQEVAEHYRKAIALEARNTLFHYYYGLHLRREQRVSEAAAEFRAAIALDGNLAEAHLNLGLILDETGQEADGIRELERAVALAPDLARAYYALGRIHARRKEIVESGAMMRRFQELKAGEAESSQRRFLAGAMSSLGAQ